VYQQQYDPRRCRIISWNVNGLRQRHQMNQFLPLFRHNPDIVCIQEAKTAVSRIPREVRNLRGYTCYFKEGHPDTMTDVMIFSRCEPERITFGFGNSRFDKEGRVLVAEFKSFTLMNMYFPLGIGPVENIDHKLAFYDEFIAWISGMNTGQRNIVVCGDFSIAHTDNDVERPVRKTTRRAGITCREREKIDQVIQTGFSDTFRLFSGSNGHYSWWPNGFSVEERRLGWRLDYFFVNSPVRPFVTGTEILASHEGSDHCPVMMTMTLPEKLSPSRGRVPEPAYGSVE